MRGRAGVSPSGRNTADLGVGRTTAIIARRSVGRKANKASVTRHPSSLNRAQINTCMGTTASQSIEIRGALGPADEAVLAPAAQRFLADLVRQFRPRVRDALAARGEFQQVCDRGEFSPAPNDSGDQPGADWVVEPVPDLLRSRTVELTGPADRKTLINGLNAQANCFMADLDNAMTASWPALLQAQRNLADAVAGTLDYQCDRTGKRYQMHSSACILMVRPRSWHMWEKHVYVDGEAAPGALVDFGLFVWHNLGRLQQAGRGAYFYLPKISAVAEAELWRDVIAWALRELKSPESAIKVTVLTESLPAVLQLDEILHALRKHVVAVNCGRWDYILSAWKCLRHRPDWMLPDRQQLDLNQPFLRAWMTRVRQIAHRRGVLALGGMCPELPVKNDAEANAAAFAAVRQDKLLERACGLDGGWVAHPDLAPLAAEISAADPATAATDSGWTDPDLADLLTAPVGTISEAGVRHGISVVVQYLASWLSGRGCVPLYNCMEDAATADVCRAQVWQCLHVPGALLEGGGRVDQALFAEMLDEELANIEAEVGAPNFVAGRYAQAAKLFSSLCLAPEFAEFLGPAAYELLD